MRPLLPEAFKQQVIGRVLRTGEMIPPHGNWLPKWKWIEMYGGQALLDKEGFEVIPCDPKKCDDSVCHGWRVRPIDQCGN